MPMSSTETVTIGRSPIKLIFLIDMSLLMTALFAAIVPGLIPIPAIERITVVFGVLGEARYLVGYVGMAFFGLCTLGWIGRLIFSFGPVITLSPEGFRDKRIAREIIPWQAIIDISTWGGRQKVIVLRVDPLFLQKLTLTKVAHHTLRANMMMGADGLCVSATGLQTNFDRLHALIKTYRS